MLFQPRMPAPLPADECNLRIPCMQPSHPLHTYCSSAPTRLPLPPSQYPAGRISIKELVDIIKEEHDAKKETKMLKKMAIIMAVLLVFALAGTVGLVAAVIFEKEHEIEGSGHMHVKGTDITVKTSSGDYSVGANAALNAPGSNDQNPHIIGTAPVVTKYSLAQTLTVLDPKYSGCPTHEFKKCYVEVIAKTLASIKTVTLPGSEDSIEGMTVFQVSSATLQNGTVKVGPHDGRMSSLLLEDWTSSSSYRRALPTISAVPSCSYIASNRH
jgi:hypothetical protein